MSKQPHEKIGIFKGKERLYNELILRSLFVEPLKDWSIAKNVLKLMQDSKRLPRKWRNLTEESDYKLTQKINSILIRRNGRLQDLLSKNYILRKEDNHEEIWHLTLKGVLALLVLDKSLINDVIDDKTATMQELINLSRTKATHAARNMSYFGMNVKLDFATYDKITTEFFKPLRTSEGWLNLVSQLEKAVGKGLDLDAMDSQDLILWVNALPTIRKLYTDFMKQEGVNP